MRVARQDQKDSSSSGGAGSGEEAGLRKILVTGVPVPVWEWFTEEAVRRNEGRLGGGACGGRSSLILAAMMEFMAAETAKPHTRTARRRRGKE